MVVAGKSQPHFPSSGSLISCHFVDSVFRPFEDSSARNPGHDHDPSHSIISFPPSSDATALRRGIHFVPRSLTRINVRTDHSSLSRTSKEGGSR